MGFRLNRIQDRSRRCWVLNLIAVGGYLCILAGPSLARDCQPETKTKLSSVQAPQADRDVLCAGVSLLERSSEATFTARDYANLASAGQDLRRAGYKSRAMYLELLPIAAVRPSTDLALVANAYAHSAACLTPEIVMIDITNALHAGRTQRERQAAMQMYRGWDRDFFAIYLAMIGQSNGCTFR